MGSKLAASVYDDSPRLDMLRLIPLNARRVLDVGCHTGEFGYAAKNQTNATVWGVEPNPETAKVAEQRLDRVFNGFFSDALALEDNYFDVISFNDVLEHMPDPWAALQLAARKLAPDGIVLVSIPNLRHIDNLMHILRERDFNYEPTGVRDKTHLRFFTRKSAPRLFDDSGLEMVSIEGINEVYFSSPARRIVYWLFKNNLDDTKHLQYAMVARRKPPTG